MQLCKINYGSSKAGKNVTRFGQTFKPAGVGKAKQYTAASNLPNQFN
jgi:hypothetical protein